ncbi:MAG TPA: zinc-dependent alcohol dehydrogenase family protein [Acidobacteriaceae bacterium]
MKAFIFERNGEPTDVLGLRDLPDPVPGPGEVLVRIRLSPIHPLDLHVLRGRFGRQPTPPTSPGVECVGVVEALGPGVAGPAPGTRVVLVDVWGTWRELVVSAAERVVPVPDGVSDEDAAQAIVNPVTAWVLTMIEHRLQPGEWMTQTAAGSTVGRLVLQLARSEGFKTINIVRRRAQVPEIAELGGDITLCTEDDDWSSQLVKAGGGRGPSKAIDCVAGRVGATLARTLAPAGRLLVYGALSSHRQTEPSAFEMPLFAPRLIYGAATVQGWFQPHWFDTRPLSECVQTVKTVLDRLASSALRLPPATRHHPSQIDVALRDAEASARDGKPLLDFTRI